MKGPTEERCAKCGEGRTSVSHYFFADGPTHLFVSDIPAEVATTHACGDPDCIVPHPPKGKRPPTEAVKDQPGRCAESVPLGPANLGSRLCNAPLPCERHPAVKDQDEREEWEREWLNWNLHAPTPEEREMERREPFSKIAFRAGWILGRSRSKR